METIEIERATDPQFAVAAAAALAHWRFAPATIRGCPVSQAIEVPFDFLLPPAAPPPNG
jgi:hypothetical protein